MKLYVYIPDSFLELNELLPIFTSNEEYNGVLIEEFTIDYEMPEDIRATYADKINAYIKDTREAKIAELKGKIESMEDEIKEVSHEKFLYSL